MLVLANASWQLWLHAANANLRWIASMSQPVQRDRPTDVSRETSEYHVGEAVVRHCVDGARVGEQKRVVGYIIV